VLPPSSVIALMMEAAWQYIPEGKSELRRISSTADWNFYIRQIVEKKVGM
jgi:hypothetical protein